MVQKMILHNKRPPNRMQLDIRNNELKPIENILLEILYSDAI